jgi:hypothetical protein
MAERHTAGGREVIDTEGFDPSEPVTHESQRSSAHQATQIESEKHLKIAERMLLQRQGERRLRMAETEDRVLETAQQVVEATLEAHLVTAEQEIPPAEWIEKYGDVGAAQRLSVSRAGWLPAGKAPNFVVMAARVMVGIAKARGQAAAAMAGRVAPELNVKISVPAPTANDEPGLVKYEERDLE